MNPSYEQSLKSLVKDEVAIAALKAHFQKVLDLNRLDAGDIERLPNEIVGAQTRAFEVARLVIDFGFSSLGDYQDINSNQLDEDAGL